MSRRIRTSSSLEEEFREAEMGGSSFEALPSRNRVRVDSVVPHRLVPRRRVLLPHRLKGRDWMTTLAVYDIGNQKVSEIELDDRIFDAKINPSLFYDVVRMSLASQRKGSASTKNKTLVRGGGAKPWKQKGTGRARAGSRRSPLWRGGGT